MLDKQKLIDNLQKFEDTEKYSVEVRPTTKEETPEEIWNMENSISFVIKIIDKRNATENKQGTLVVAGFRVDLKNDDIPEEVYAKDMHAKIQAKIDDIMSKEPDNTDSE
jgi:hypothetical protein